MSRLNRDTRALLRTVERSERRSRLFWWFVEHHDEFAAASQHGRIDWIGFCAKAATLGLLDTRGEPPTERNARETWRQARKAVASAREREAARAVQAKRVGAIPPSRLPKDWKPSGFRVPVPAAAVSAQPARQLTTEPVFRPPTIDEGRPPEPSPESDAAMMDYLMGRGPRPRGPTEPLTAEAQIRRLRGEMNLRSGRRWDDPGDYGDKK